LTALTDTSATEISSTNAPGWYRFDLTQGETNGNTILYSGKSATSGVIVVGQRVHPSVNAQQIGGTAQTGNDVGADVNDILADTADMQPKIGTPVTSLAADIAAIEAQTDDIGTAGAGLTAVPWNAAWDAEVQSEVADALAAFTGTSFTAIPWNAAWGAEVQSEVADALAAYDPPTNAEMEARTLAAASYATAAVIGTPAGASIAADLVSIKSDSSYTYLVANNVVGSGTVTTGASTTSVPTSSMSPSGASADQFKGRILTFNKATTTAALRGVASVISASSNASAPTFTLQDALPATPASGDTFTVS
jgi:hypothetical protein